MIRLTGCGMVSSRLKNGLDCETTLRLEWQMGALRHLHCILQCPLHEWNNDRPPMGCAASDIIERPGGLHGCVRCLLDMLGIHGLPAQYGFCRRCPDYGRCHRTKRDLDLLTHIVLCR